MKISYKIMADQCIGCGACVSDCTMHNFYLVDGKAKDRGLCMGCGHCVAICPSGAIRLQDKMESDQVLEYEPGKFDIEAEVFLNAVKYRRSIRKFLDKPVDNEIIEKIIEAGRYTATSGNNQDVEYIVLNKDLNETGKRALKALSDWGTRVIESGEALDETTSRYARVCIQNWQNAQKTGNMASFFFNAPVVIGIVCNNVVNGALAAANMEHMAVSLGLGACYSGFLRRAVLNSTDLQAYLNMKPDQTMSTALMIGYTDLKYFRTVPRNPAVITWR